MAAPVTVAVSEDEVRQRVLALVAEQTGYPEDMFDLDLDLEADLGVDTVKQAELFATVREVYGIAREDTLQLRDFPTLNHVIAFALDRAGGAEPTRPQADDRPPPRPLRRPSRRRSARRLSPAWTSATRSPAEFPRLCSARRWSSVARPA